MSQRLVLLAAALPIVIAAATLSGRQESADSYPGLDESLAVILVAVLDRLAVG
jgi:hypothetical protein